MADIFELFKKIEKKETAPLTPPTHIIVGLGNPGREYERTRHNAGYMAIDYLADKLGVSGERTKFNALLADATLGAYRVLMMKPLTYMNASGEAVHAAADFYKIPLSNIVVLVDDVTLDPGRMRVRASGSDGGQRGLRSIITQFSDDKFPRIRFGVGKKPNPEYDLADWVVGVLPPADRAAMESCFPLLPEAIEKIFAGKIDAAMGICNGHTPSEAAK